jgi:hypothetical protein
MCSGDNHITTRTHFHEYRNLRIVYFVQVIGVVPPPDNVKVQLDLAQTKDTLAYL